MAGIIAGGSSNSPPGSLAKFSPVFDEHSITHPHYYKFTPTTCGQQAKFLCFISILKTRKFKTTPNQYS